MTPPAAAEPAAAANGRESVVVVGGGIAGLEALLALHALAGERVATKLVSATDEFVYRPWLVGEPFGPEAAERRDLAPIAAEAGAEFERAELQRVRPERRRIEAADGREIGYDRLVVCLGGRQRAVYPGVATLGLGREPVDVNALLREAAVSQPPRLSLIVPPVASWPLPIYEVALMAQRRARELELEVELEVITPEQAPLIAFGRLPSDAVAELLRTRGIAVRASTHAEAVADGILLRPGDERLDAGAMLALPALEGPALAGLPADEQGFIPIDDHARVIGVDRVYAAGDGTTFPIKQGGLATQQADAAVEHIAAQLGCIDGAEPFHPILRGRLLTGDESLSLAADVGGGSGEGAVSPDALWWPPEKVGGRYLAPFLAGSDMPLEDEPPQRATDVEVALPRGWHREPIGFDPFGPPPGGDAG